MIQKRVGTSAPLNAIAMAATLLTGINRLAGAIYDHAAFILDRYTPEKIKAGVVSDYGVPEAVIDQRTLMQGRQRVQLRNAGRTEILADRTALVLPPLNSIAKAA